MKPRYHSLWGIASLLIVIAVACSPLGTPTPGSVEPTLSSPLPPTQTPLPVASPTAEAVEPALPADVYAPAFAAFKPVAVDIPATFNGGDYTLPVDLAGVQFADQIQFTETQRQLLSQNGFVVLPPKPGEYREFYQVYEAGRYDMHPVFVTTDSIYHVYHLLFDKMMRDLERDSFIASLNTLTSTMLDASYRQYQALQGTALEEPALRNVAFFAVAAQLLGLPDAVPSEAADLVNAELALIEKMK